MDNVTIFRGDTPVLERLSLTIEEGEHTVILGPNGCGKSTLIKALTRELYPYGGQGSVRVCGLDRWVISELRTLIGVVSEDPRVTLLGSPTGLDLAVSGLLGTYGVTAQHNVSAEMRYEAMKALARLKATRLSEQPVETMSTGERRRVWIARAMVSRPKALVLDEPTNGLDMKAAHEFYEMVESLANSGVTVILVTHHLEEIVPSIRRAILMSRGSVVADGDRNQILRTEILKRAFEIDDPVLEHSLEIKLELLHHTSRNLVVTKG